METSDFMLLVGADFAGARSGRSRGDFGRLGGCWTAETHFAIIRVVTQVCAFLDPLIR